MKYMSTFFHTVQIGFTQTEHTVREDERAVTVTVAVLQGTLDNETTAIVVLHTQDGSAKGECENT